MASPGRPIVDSSGRIALYGKLGRAHELVSEPGKAKEAYEKMLAEGRGAADRTAEWMALRRLATLGILNSAPPEDEELLLGVRERPEEKRQTPERLPFAWSPTEARRHAEAALDLARDLGRDDLVAASTHMLAELDAWLDRWEGCERSAREAAALYVRLGDRAEEAEVLGILTVCATFRGRPREGAGHGRRALAIADERASARNVAGNAFPAAQALAEAGELGEALATARRGVGAARSLGHAPLTFHNLLTLGDVHRSLLATEAAEGAYREAARSLVFPQLRGALRSRLCAVAALRGDWREAGGNALAARGLGAEEFPVMSEVHRHFEVEALLRVGEERVARAVAGRLGDRVEGNPRLCLAHLRCLAPLSRWGGDADLALARLREAEALAEKIGLPGELWQIRAEIGDLHRGCGEHEEARTVFGRAAEVLRKLAGKIDAAEVRQSFLSAPLARRVFERASGEQHV